MLEFIQVQYLMGKITDAQLDMLVTARKITADQAAEIKAAKTTTV